MNLSLDLTALMRRELTGIGVYVRSLLEHLRVRPDVNVHGTWRLSRFAKRELLALHVPAGTGPYIPFLSGLNIGGIDVHHGPDFRIPRRGRFAKVVTVHDLVIHEKGLVDERFASEGIAKLRYTLLDCRPDRIITISRFTARRLAELYPALEPIIRTVPLGVDPRRFTPGSPGKRIVDAPYILSVGSVEKRKNLSNSIRAFEMAREQGADVHLVIAGCGGHGVERIDEAIASSPHRTAIHKLGFVPDQDLPDLYRGAEMFLYPSLYEGFGIPIIEGMASGTPVITSDRGAMAEVAGDAAMLVDPTSPESIADGMMRLLHDSAVRGKLRRAALGRAAGFTWSRCAAGTLDVYREVIG